MGGGEVDVMSSEYRKFAKRYEDWREVHGEVQSAKIVRRPTYGDKLRHCLQIEADNCCGDREQVVVQYFLDRDQAVRIGLDLLCLAASMEDAEGRDLEPYPRGDGVNTFTPIPMRDVIDGTASEKFDPDWVFAEDDGEPFVEPSKRLRGGKYRHQAKRERPLAMSDEAKREWAQKVANYAIALLRGDEGR